MGKMLAVQLTDEMTAILILCMALIVGVSIVIGLKTHYKKERKMVTKRQPKSLSFKPAKQYLSHKEWKFLNSLFKALPNEFVAFPKVKLTNLVTSGKDKHEKDMIKDFQVDVCVFLREGLEPILAIDLVEDEASNITFKNLHPLIKQVLKTVKIPLLEVPVQDNYDLVALRKNVITNMPDKIVAVLKQNFIEK